MPYLQPPLFWGLVTEWVVAQQLQIHLDTICFLDPCYSGFQPGYSTETALVALVNNQHLDIDTVNCTLLYY